jgi:hypothetical protein
MDVSTIHFNDLYKYMAATQQKYEKDREYNDSTYMVRNAVITKSKNYLDVIFMVNPTYGDGQPEAGVTDKVKSINNRYLILVRFYDINKWITNYDQYKLALRPDQEQMIFNILQNASLKIFSDDPSFYWQGMWKDADDQGFALFRMDPRLKAKDTGYWKAKSGYMPIRVTKHIGQISLDSAKGKNMVASSINSVLMSSTLKMRENQKRSNLIENRYEEYVESILNDPRFKALSKLKEQSLYSYLTNHGLSIGKNDIINANVAKKIDLGTSDTSYVSEEGLDGLLKFLTEHKINSNQENLPLELKRSDLIKKINLFGFKNSSDEIVSSISSVGWNVYVLFCLWINWALNSNNVKYKYGKNESEKKSSDVFNAVKRISNLYGKSIISSLVTNANNLNVTYLSTIVKQLYNNANFKNSLNEYSKIIYPEGFSKNKNIILTQNNIELLLQSLVTAVGLSSRNQTGRGELTTALLVGGYKAGFGDVTVPDLNSVSGATANNKNQIEVKFGDARMDGGERKATTLSDSDWKAVLVAAMKTAGIIKDDTEFNFDTFIEKEIEWAKNFKVIIPTKESFSHNHRFAIREAYEDDYADDFGGSEDDDLSDKTDRAKKGKAASELDEFNDNNSEEDTDNPFEDDNDEGKNSLYQLHSSAANLKPEENLTPEESAIVKQIGEVTAKISRSLNTQANKAARNKSENELVLRYNIALWAATIDNLGLTGNDSVKVVSNIANILKGGIKFNEDVLSAINDIDIASKVLDWRNQMGITDEISNDKELLKRLGISTNNINSAIKDEPINTHSTGKKNKVDNTEQKSLNQQQKDKVKQDAKVILNEDFDFLNENVSLSDEWLKEVLDITDYKKHYSHDGLNLLMDGRAIKGTILEFHKANFAIYYPILTQWIFFKLINPSGSPDQTMSTFLKDFYGVTNTKDPAFENGLETQVKKEGLKRSSFYLKNILREAEGESATIGPYDNLTPQQKLEKLKQDEPLILKKISDFWFNFMKNIWNKRYVGEGTQHLNETNILLKFFTKFAQANVSGFDVTKAQFETNLNLRSEEINNLIVSADFYSYAYTSIKDEKQLHPNFGAILFMAPMDGIKNKFGMLLIPTLDDKGQQNISNGSSAVERNLNAGTLIGNQFSKDTRASNVQLGINGKTNNKV